jgi:hypothetical protein
MSRLDIQPKALSVFVALRHGRDHTRDLQIEALKRWIQGLLQVSLCPKAGERPSQQTTRGKRENPVAGSGPAWGRQEIGPGPGSAPPGQASQQQAAGNGAQEDGGLRQLC